MAAPDGRPSPKMSSGTQAGSATGPSRTDEHAAALRRQANRYNPGSGYTPSTARHGHDVQRVHERWRSSCVL